MNYILFMSAVSDMAANEQGLALLGDLKIVKPGTADD